MTDDIPTIKTNSMSFKYDNSNNILINENIKTKNNNINKEYNNSTVNESCFNSDTIKTSIDQNKNFSQKESLSKRIYNLRLMYGQYEETGILNNNIKMCKILNNNQIPTNLGLTNNSINVNNINTNKQKTVNNVINNNNNLPNEINKTNIDNNYFNDVDNNDNNNIANSNKVNLSINYKDFTNNKKLNSNNSNFEIYKNLNNCLFEDKSINKITKSTINLINNSGFVCIDANGKRTIHNKTKSLKKIQNLKNLYKSKNINNYIDLNKINKNKSNIIKENIILKQIKRSLKLNDNNSNDKNDYKNKFNRLLYDTNLNTTSQESRRQMNLKKILQERLVRLDNLIKNELSNNVLNN